MTKVLSHFLNCATDDYRSLDLTDRYIADLKDIDIYSSSCFTNDKRFDSLSR